MCHWWSWSKRVSIPKKFFWTFFWIKTIWSFHRCPVPTRLVGRSKLPQASRYLALRSEVAYCPRRADSAILHNLHEDCDGLKKQAAESWNHKTHIQAWNVGYHANANKRFCRQEGHGAMFIFCRLFRAFFRSVLSLGGCCT